MVRLGWRALPARRSLGNLPSWQPPREGPATWNALAADPNMPRLARGSTGSVVSALQKALASYGGPNTPTDPGPIDGDFGPSTESAVRAYQTDRGVIADGVVGDQTWWVPAGAAGRTLASLASLVTV
jgi:peptidoglycan hydrolase-like protein with peptidoglycan-binding domain